MPAFTPGSTPSLDAPGMDSPEDSPGAAVAPMQPTQVQLRGGNTSAANLAMATTDAIGSDQPRLRMTKNDVVPTGGGFKRLLAGAGAMAKQNPVGVASGVLGAAGAIINATTKTPELPAYRDFTPSIAPATGMNTGLKAQLLARITANAQRAGQPQTVDANLNAATRLAVAASAGEQQMQVEQQDQQLFQQNQQRRDQQQLETDKINHDGRQQQRLQKFDVDNRRAEARRATGTAMVQGAATYFTQAEAAGRQEKQTALQGQYDAEAQQAQNRYTQLLQARASGNLTAQQVALIDQQLAQIRATAGTAPRQTFTQRTTTVRRFGGRVPLLKHYAAGGKLTSSVSVSVGGRRAAADPAARIEQHFRRSMEAVTRQATQQFSATLRDVLRIRSQSLAHR